MGRVAFRNVADPSFPGLHIRPPQGWLNDPNGLCRIDGRYHVFFQYNPIAPIFGAMHWGHVSSTDLVHWQEHPMALSPRPGHIDEAGCWSGCIVDDGGVPTAVYTANPDHPRNAVAALARSDRSMIHWQQDPSPIVGITKPSGIDEVRDPFIFVHDGHRYAVQGAGQPSGKPRLQLYGCDDLSRWTELGTLLSTDDPIAGEVASANIWECPNLVRIDGHWALLVSLCQLTAEFHSAGVRYLLGDLVAQGPGWAFKATSGGLVDSGPSFYAPQVLAEPGRTLLWGWAREVGRTDREIADAGWAGVLTFPRELYVGDGGGLGLRPVMELEGLRQDKMAVRAAEPFQAHAFELVAHGPVTLRLIDDGADDLVSAAEAAPADPARILVDGSIVETFHGGKAHTTRAYPTVGSSWVVEGDVTAYRLGDRVHDSIDRDLRPSVAARLSS